MACVSCIQVEFTEIQHSAIFIAVLPQKRCHLGNGKIKRRRLTNTNGGAKMSVLIIRMQMATVPRRGGGSNIVMFILDLIQRSRLARPQCLLLAVGR